MEITYHATWLLADHCVELNEDLHCIQRSHLTIVRNAARHLLVGLPSQSCTAPPLLVEVLVEVLHLFTHFPALRVELQRLFRRTQCLSSHLEPLSEKQNGGMGMMGENIERSSALRHTSLAPQTLQKAESILHIHGKCWVSLKTSVTMKVKEAAHRTFVPIRPPLDAFLCVLQCFCYLVQFQQCRTPITAFSERRPRSHHETKQLSE
jgi:hypothetical protein